MEDNVIHNKATILNNFLVLAKNKCSVSADLDAQTSLVTSIIAVDTKNEVIILDDNGFGKRLLSTPEIKFKTAFNGIQIAFTAHNIRKTKHDGYDALAMPVPRSLFWLNRREYYRVKTPIANPCLCRIAIPELSENATTEEIESYNLALEFIKKELLAKMEAEEMEEKQAFLQAYSKMSVENKIKAKLEREQLLAEREENPPEPPPELLNITHFPLRDISLSGFALNNTNPIFSPFLEAGKSYPAALIIPDKDEIPINFEIIIRREIEAHKIDDYAEVVGIKFVDLHHLAQSALLRYIQDLERLAF